MLAMLGCGGYLLREVGLVESESCDEYVRFIRPTLLLRRNAGVDQPRVISDNPELISRGLPGLVRSLWGDFWAPQRPGAPVFRKIDFGDSIAIARQDSDEEIRDFAYTIRRSARLLPGAVRSSFDAAYKSIADEVESLSIRIEDTSLGPFRST